MEYVFYRPFKGKTMSGDTEFKVGTVCTEDKGTVYYKGQPIFMTGSKNANEHLALNDDGRGLERGQLITEIKRVLALTDDHAYERWHRVWNAPICKQFNSDASGETWLWNFAFYHASPAYLQRILEIVTDPNWLGITPETEAIE